MYNMYVLFSSVAIYLRNNSENLKISIDVVDKKFIFQRKVANSMLFYGDKIETSLNEGTFRVFMIELRYLYK